MSEIKISEEEQSRSSGSFNSLKQVVLIACGSYSPPTFLHLSIFETARNYLQYEKKLFDVIGGYISPVHDGYGKASLIDQDHRVNMCKLACSSSEWISTLTWETEQKTWTPTASVLKEYQEWINNKYSSESSIGYSNENKTQVLFLCGTDLSESFLKPNVWSLDDQEYILSHGVVCMERESNCNLNDVKKLIEDNPLLKKYKDSIWIIPQPVQNNISSTHVRSCIKNNQSIKYLIPDNVIDYIKAHNLYTK